MTGILQQRREHLKRLFLKPDANAVLAQFPSGQVDFNFDNLAAAAANIRSGKLNGSSLFYIASLSSKTIDAPSKTSSSWPPTRFT